MVSKNVDARLADKAVRVQECVTESEREREKKECEI